MWARLDVSSKAENVYIHMSHRNITSNVGLMSHTTHERSCPSDNLPAVNSSTSEDSLPMPATTRRHRAPLHGAIVTAALPAITLAGLGATASAAQAAPSPKPTTARNLFEARAQVAAQISAAKASRAVTVTVKKNDTVWKLAQAHGVKVADVLRLNNLPASGLIHPGDRLTLRAATASKASTVTKASSTKKSSTSRSSASTHTVKAGDTLSGIAHQHGVSLSTLLSANGLKLSSIIYPGQVVKLGGSAHSSAKSTSAKSSTPVRTAAAKTTTAKATSYTVRAGDTLSGIAAKHGVKLSELLEANHLTVDSTIYVGRTVKLPGADSKPAVGKTFLTYTYSDETNRSANQNHAALASMSVPSPAQMELIVRSRARRYGVNENLAVAHAKVESGLNARAVSPANAVGVMQVLPSTAEWMGQTIGKKLNPLNPYDNVTAGVLYIRYLQKNASSREIGIAGYYQGLGGVQKNGMKPDTKDYVKRVKSYL